MEPITDTDYGSQTPKKRPGNSSASRAKAARSAPKSKGRSRGGQGTDGTQPAGSQPTDSEVGLSILQVGFDQALNEGVMAKLEHLPPTEATPHHRILIEVWNAAICRECQAWTEQRTCSACGSQIG